MALQRNAPTEIGGDSDGGCVFRAELQFSDEKHARPTITHSADGGADEFKELAERETLELNMRRLDETPRSSAARNPAAFDDLRLRFGILRHMGRLAANVARG